MDVGGVALTDRVADAAAKAAAMACRLPPEVLERRSQALEYLRAVHALHRSKSRLWWQRMGALCGRVGGPAAGLGCGQVDSWAREGACRQT